MTEENEEIKNANQEQQSEKPIEVVEIKEEIKDIGGNNQILNDTKDPSKKKRKNLINYILIAILLIAIIALGILDYPKISKYLKTKTNPFSFDYNFRKVRNYDWDTMITERNVAKALGVPLQKINSAKNPDYSWVLEDPKQFTETIKCAALIDEKILNEADENNKNLYNINIMLCDNKSEANTTFSGRKDETQNVGKSDPTIAVKSFEETKKFGDQGYSYSIEKTTTQESTDPKTPATTSIEKFGGISFISGPFVVMIDESEQTGMAKLSDPNSRDKLVKYIDNQLKKLLAWY